MSDFEHLNRMDPLTFQIRKISKSWTCRPKVCFLCGKILVGSSCVVYLGEPLYDQRAHRDCAEQAVGHEPVVERRSGYDRRQPEKRSQVPRRQVDRYRGR